MMNLQSPPSNEISATVITSKDRGGDYLSAAEKAMTEFACQPENIIDKELLQLAMLAKSVKHGKSDAELMGEAASFCDGYFNINCNSQFGKWPQFFIEKGWLVEHPTKSGWYTIPDDEESHEEEESNE